MLERFEEKETTLHRGIFVIVVFLVAAAVFEMNRMTPWIVDDFLKANALPEHGRSLQDIVYGLSGFYMGWGGRIWGEFFALGLLSIPKSLVNVLNTAGYLLMVFFVELNISGGRKASVSLFLFLNFALWMFLPAFGQDILWISGCANYMWSSLIPLTLLAVFRRQAQAPSRVIEHPLSYPFLAILGLLAGWMNENVSVALLWILGGYLLNCRMERDYHPVPMALKISFVGTLLGSLRLWLAPGNFVRFGAEHHTTSLLIIFKKVLENCFALLQVDTGLVLLFLIVMLLIFGKSNEKSFPCSMEAQLS